MKQYRFTWHVSPNIMSVAVFSGKTKKECVEIFKLKYGLFAFKLCVMKNITNEKCAYGFAC